MNNENVKDVLTPDEWLELRRMAVKVLSNEDLDVEEETLWDILCGRAKLEASE